ncbi:hypothetical protein [Devosia sp.]|uniref:hypothetical protein n=1 Tax=Devosia sp. TaxID=1871048 RepID=UPI00273546E7|nr:hypothetical protein [Devosia sp.]MDP2781898.1 hypothetical protein [Devosia sp.]
MAILRVMLICLAASMSVTLARAEDGRWFALAESTDPDEAIGIALAHRWWFETIAVAANKTGGYVTLGRLEDETKNDADALTELLGSGNWPAGIEVVSAASLGEPIWSLPDATVARHEFRHGDDGRIVSDGISIQMSSQLDVTDDTFKPMLAVVEQGNAVHQTTLADSGTDGAFARIRIAWLDRTATRPQIVFSGYTMGAHCCTVTRILTRDEDGWIEVDGGWHDGDEGYRIEDVDGNGEFELIARDDRFLNRFAPYATSWTPIRVFKLAGGALFDVSREPAYEPTRRRELHAFEHHADHEPGLWRETGFLAGWVALKSVLGERQEAWPRMIETYTEDGFWNHVACETDFVEGACPGGESRSAPFPEALEDYLRRTGLW